MRVKNRNIALSPDKLKNILQYDNVDYTIKSLNEDYYRSKGGNSSVFILTDSQEKTEYVIKFSKHNLNDKKIVSRYWDRIERFEREINALNIAKANNFEFVIKILFEGDYDIGKQSFKYFVMEKADYDLTDFLKSTELTVQQRFLTCTEILAGIKELHSKDIYHRDIKPDNILLVNGSWKVSDLGLIGYRDDDFKSKELGMKIGPANWMSPEAFNKMYNEGDGFKNSYKFDCELDEMSDIFQLGKLFWFIFQGNIPDGQLIRNDFKIEDDQVFEVLLNMLNHSKGRPSIIEIEEEFKSRYAKYII
jgi:serine/threonine protein kinase